MSRTKATIPPPARPEEARRAWARVRDLSALAVLKGAPRPERVRPAVEWFADTPRSEAAFLARYRAMRPLKRQVLLDYIGTENPWDGYRVLCWAYGLCDRARPHRHRAARP